MIEDSLGNAISGILWASEILQSDSTIFVNTASKLITFRFYFTFPSSAAAQSFSDVFVQYHGVNSQSEITKSMNIRFYGSCSTPVLSHFDQTTIHVRDTSVRVRISIGDDDVDDYLSQPISVWLNGEWKFTNHALSRAEVYNWTLRADTTNALLVICNGHAHSFDNYAMVTFNSFHAVKCDLDPGKGHVIYIKP